MNYVEPLKTAENIRKVSEYLKKENDRNFLLFYLGINTPMKLRDLLNLKVIDVLNKSKIPIISGRKAIMWTLNESLQQAIRDYCKDKNSMEYLFKALRTNINKPIKESQVNKIINKAGKDLSINNLGASTLRKTFGYFFYMQTKDIDTLMKLFNHHDKYYCFQYIGLNKNNFIDRLENWQSIEI